MHPEDVAVLDAMEEGVLGKLDPWQRREALRFLVLTGALRFHYRDTDVALCCAAVLINLVDYGSMAANLVSGGIAGALMVVAGGRIGTTISAVRAWHEENL